MGTILLRNLSPEDSGDYVCYSNDRGKFKFGGVSVRVVGKLNCSIWSHNARMDGGV